MCCRYWADESPELRAIVEEMNRSSLVRKWQEKTQVKTRGEIRPADVVPVIAPNRSGQRDVFLSKKNPAQLILVMHILRKAHQIPDREHPAVVKHRPAAHPPEDLMLVAHDEFCVDLGRAVQYGDKIHLKPAVA